MLHAADCNRAYNVTIWLHVLHIGKFWQHDSSTLTDIRIFYDGQYTVIIFVVYFTEMALLLLGTLRIKVAIFYKQTFEF